MNCCPVHAIYADERAGARTVDTKSASAAACSQACPWNMPRRQRDRRIHEVSFRADAAPSSARTAPSVHRLGGYRAEGHRPGRREDDDPRASVGAIAGHVRFRPAESAGRSKRCGKGQKPWNTTRCSRCCRCVSRPSGKTVEAAGRRPAVVGFSWQPLGATQDDDALGEPTNPIARVRSRCPLQFLSAGE